MEGNFELQLKFEETTRLGLKLIGSDEDDSYKKPYNRGYQRT